MALRLPLAFRRVIAKQACFCPNQRQRSAIEIRHKLAGFQLMQITAGDLIVIPGFGKFDTLRQFLLRKG
ncbi:Uncharacterised protein [Salmonella enterica subsp. enterica serovar Typhi]|nr:Uncharacterised protein [Salmonella enterica subsp. enterica serovar Typhi]CPR48399.1 Uncharacterised protein [Salmonella enterica subsp. enterica serovar Bovismorbificans]CQE29547.1 Uncharacterised protein [Salmonella enterica subsp. enterica serovar Typhimurium str. DT104]CGX78120.1 Uncharacterised protein [Salmonella enterica subsp. enterica serovar Typhi]CQU00176.1 Uncharacterised protein [Salmonella enterica subsp. enterica serovar Typhi]